MKMIDVQNLSFSYQKNEKDVLRDLNFSCEKGTINVLIGLNGSGKTTLIKILAGLYEKYRGGVSIGGNNLKTLSVKQRSKIMSYVAQRSGLIDDFSVKEYLLFGRVNKMNFYQSPAREDQDRVLEYAAQFGITGLLDKKLGEISGGERQIVSICSAVIQDTELIILDEPTSALDIRNQHKVLSLIREIATEQKKTFVLSSHNPNHALYLNSDVFVLQEGKIIEKGNAHEMVDVEKLKRVYGDKLCYSSELDYKEISFY